MREAISDVEGNGGNARHETVKQMKRTQRIVRYLLTLGGNGLATMHR